MTVSTPFAAPRQILISNWNQQYTTEEKLPELVSQMGALQVCEQKESEDDFESGEASDEFE